MSVVTAIEEVGPCRQKLTIEIPAEAVDAERGRVVSEFRRHVNLPGFRKGKAPQSLLLRRFGDEIQSELVDRLLPRYWKQAEAEKDLDPLMQPQVEDLKAEPGEPMVAVVIVETRPELTLGDIESFDLPAEPGDPSDAELEEALGDLRRSYAEWEPVDRAAAQGDMIVGTILRIDDGAADDEEARPIHFEIGADGADEELSLALTDKKAKQTIEHGRTVGEGDDAEEHLYEITVDEVREQSLPEVDDEFAKEKIGFDSAEELRAAVSRSLAERQRAEVRRQRETALLEQLRTRHPLTLPEGVVKQELDRLVHEMAEQLMRQGVSLETAKLDFEQMASDLRPQAEKRVHDRLVLDAVARELELRLDELKFERFLGAAAAQQNTTSQALRQRLADDGRLEDLRAQLLREQTVAHLLGEVDDEDDEPSALDDEPGYLDDDEPGYLDDDEPGYLDDDDSSDDSPDDEASTSPRAGDDP